MFPSEYCIWSRLTQTLLLWVAFDANAPTKVCIYTSMRTASCCPQVRAFTIQPPPDRPCSAQLGVGIGKVYASAHGTFRIAFLRGLPHLHHRLPVMVGKCDEWPVGGGVDAVERAVRVSAILLAVYRDGAALIGGWVSHTPSVSLCAVRGCRAAPPHPS